MADSSRKPATIDERHEFMVSPTGGLPVFREARFLESTVASIEGPRLKLPSLSPKPKWPLEVTFLGWRNPLRKWKTWLEKMKSKYSSGWKNAGIYEALLGSVYKINRDDGMILGLAERWNSDTNTFIFPWGEATVTLEDLLILGGFSVSGAPVHLPLETKQIDENEIKNQLEESQINLEKRRNETHAQWMNLFMNSGSKIEHEAFLSLWLSWAVFPGDKFGKHVFPMAIHLANGKRLALAPSILASIYRDLGLLKETMVASTQSGEEDNTLFLNLWSPLSLVQVWAWERLPPLRPKPNFIGSGMVRMGRWHGLKSDIGNMRPAMESSGPNFLWRPYAMAADDWSLPVFYPEDDVSYKGRDLSVEMESFARCLRACQLIGIDCQEPYNPHRVSMQFGYDQDLPGMIPKENMTLEMAWHDYSRSFADDEVLYFPPRLSESDVTIRYLEWWRKTVICPVDAVKGCLRRRRSYRKALKDPEKLKKLIVGSDSDVCPDFARTKRRKQIRKLSQVVKLQDLRKVREIGKSSVDVKEFNSSLYELILLKTAGDPETPPGFSPQRDERLEKQSFFCRNGELSSSAIKPSLGIQTLAKSEQDSGYDQARGKVINSDEKESERKLLQVKTEGDLDVPPGFLRRSDGVKETEQSLESFLQTYEEIRENDKVLSDLHSGYLCPRTSATESLQQTKLDGINLEKYEYLVKNGIAELGLDESEVVGVGYSSKMPALENLEKDINYGISTEGKSTFNISGKLSNRNLVAMLDIEERFRRIERQIAAMKQENAKI